MSQIVAQQPTPAPAPIPTSHSKPFDLFALLYWLPFVLALPLAIFMALRPAPLIPILKANLPVLKHEVATYHIITQNDVRFKLFDKKDVPTDVMYDMINLIGHYTRETIPANQPIIRNQVGSIPDRHLILNTLAVAIPANSVTTLGGNLDAGDVVSLAAIPLPNNTSQPTIIFKEVLVLDVKTVGNATVLILAIPVNQWLDYLTKTRNATIVLAQQAG